MTTDNSVTFFFFNDTATTEIYTLPLHDALPICIIEIERGHYGRHGIPGDDPAIVAAGKRPRHPASSPWHGKAKSGPKSAFWRSEEHTSELQSRLNLVCRLLLGRKVKIIATFLSL